VTVILVLAEHDRGTLNDLSLQAMALGRRLASDGEPVEAVVAGAEAASLAKVLGGHGAATVHVADHEGLADFAPDAWAASVAEVMDRSHPSVVVAAGSDRGNEVMARLAARLDLPLAANVTEVTPGEAFTLTRTRWGGSLLEDATLDGDVKLLTTQPHAFQASPAEAPGAGAVGTFTPALTDADVVVRVTDRVERAGDKISLADAKVVVGGGRGVGDAAGFGVLEELADLLHGAVGCSRVVTSLGWRPHSDQVGQTGQRIAPDLYIACGISGAIQHMVGCKSAKRLFVINTDPEAPILSQADYAIIGDVRQVVPALTAALRSG
jgi:electron transfer flavoprotein alpha subunit